MFYVEMVVTCLVAVWIQYLQHVSVSDKEILVVNYVPQKFQFRSYCIHNEEESDIYLFIKFNTHLPKKEKKKTFDYVRMLAYPYATTSALSYNSYLIISK